MQTNKPTKKRAYYNYEVLETLVKKFGYSLDYVRKCIRGDRKGIMPDKIALEYRVLSSEASKAVQDKAISKTP